MIPSRDLSILCVTRAEAHAWRFVEEIVVASERLNAQAVIAIDFTGQGDDGARKVLFGRNLIDKYADVTVAGVYSKGYIESCLDDALVSCDGTYVLRLDDDERMPQQMLDWLASGAYKASPHWKFSRAHLWGDEQHYVTDLPLWPDHQTRLSLHKLSGHRTMIHSGSPYGGGELAPCLIEHHKFLVKTIEQRREIVERYDSIAQGAGTHFRAFSVPEETQSVQSVRPLAEALSIAALEGVDRVKFALDCAYKIGMHQHRDEIEPFARWLAARKPHHVVEIGTLHGGTAALWHGIATGKIVTIDLPGGPFGGADHGYDARKCLERDSRLMGEFPRLRFVHASSQDEATLDAAKNFHLKGEPVDLLFIDGDHRYEAVKADYERFKSLVRPGGVIAFHDVLDTPLHRNAGCRVDQLWSELRGSSVDIGATQMFHVFSCAAPWGGIGAIEVRA